MAITNTRPRLPASRRRLLWLAALGVVALVLAAAASLVATGGDDSGSNDVRAGGTSASSGEMTTEGGFDLGSPNVQPAPGAFDRDEESGALPPKNSSGDFGAVAPGAGGGSDGSAQLLGRTVIRNGSVDLTVESVSDSFEEVRRLTEAAGGFVADSTFRGSGEFQSASMTVRVPAEAFGQVVADLQDLAVEVNSVSTSANDVTEEFTDLQATIRNLQAVEEQYLRLLGEAEEIGDILQVQDRLYSVRLEIERTQGRLNLLEDLSDLATLSVSLSPEGAPISRTTEPGFQGQVADAWQSSLDTLESLATGVVVVAVWSWWLVPVLIVALIAWRRFGPRLGREDARSVDTPQGAA
ncbi:MAG: DUF4349 domain-containing protein [Dehalococcoidia bacterium]